MPGQGRDDRGRVRRVMTGGLSLSVLVLLGSPAPALSVAGSVASVGGPPCYYEVTVLDLVPDCGFSGEPGSITPYAIANNGLITGSYPQCDFDAGSWVAFSPDGQSIQALIPPFANFTNLVGHDITSNGIIVGFVDYSTQGRQGFTFNLNSGIWTEVPPLPGHNICSLGGVNSNGIAVGSSGNIISGPSPVAITWDGTQLINLHALLGSAKSQATDINDENAITGWRGTAQTSDSRTFVYESNGTITNYEPLTGAFASEGLAINDDNDVAGYSRMQDPEFLFGRSRATFWNDGQSIDVGALPGFRLSWGTDVNSSDIVVGTCRHTDQSINERKAFVWKNGEITALDDLIDPALEIEILEAYSINEKGQITAIAIGAELESVSAILLSPPNPADVNGDCVTNVQDLLILLGAWGMSSSPADLDGNGIVNVVDLLYLLGHWG